MNQQRLAAVYKWLCQVIEHRWFFAGTIIWFTLQAAWLALSGIYPLPFDEYYHFGITSLYTEQWSPFISIQPAEASLYGDVTRYPSYLFHYLMSFPLRLVQLFTENQTSQIIALRFLNISLFIWGIWLFRKLLLRAGISRRITHVVLLVFVSLPIVSFLAAHITYDSAVFVLTALLLLNALAVIQSKQFAVRNVLSALVIGLFGSITKETFLPIFGIVMVYLAVVLWSRYRALVIPQAFRTLKQQGTVWLIGTIVLVAIGGGLFIERYGVNQIRYGNYSPSCDKIHPISVCENYMPWYRNYQNKLNPPAEQEYGNPASYSQHWFSKIMRGYFALFSHTPTEVVWEKEPFGPIVTKALLPLPITGAYALLIIGLYAVIAARQRLWQQAFFRFAIIISSCYIVIVWAFNYQTYLALDAAQAIQARYFLPIFIIILAVFAQAIIWTVRNKAGRLALATLITVCLIYSGGIAGWIIRSEPTWYWQQPVVIRTNEHLQSVLRYLIVN